MTNNASQIIISRTPLVLGACAITLALVIATNASGQTTGTSDELDRAMSRTQQLATQLQSDLISIDKAYGQRQAIAAQLQPLIAQSSSSQVSAVTAGSTWPPQRYIPLALALPLVAFLARAFLVVRYRKHVRHDLTDKMMQIEEHRTAILAIAGFSITIFMGLAVVDATLQPNLNVAMYYAAVSFLGYFLAYSIQGYKRTFPQDLFGDCSMDLGSLCLILSLLAVLYISNIELTIKAVISVAAVLVWLYDHFIRVRVSFSYLNAMEAKAKKG